MNTDKVITELGRTIKKVCSDIKRKKGNVGCDKLDSLSKLVNSYTRLIELSRGADKGDDIDNSEFIEALNQPTPTE